MKNRNEQLDEIMIRNIDDVWAAPTNQLMKADPPCRVQLRR